MSVPLKPSTFPCLQHVLESNRKSTWSAGSTNLPTYTKKSNKAQGKKPLQWDSSSDDVVPASFKLLQLLTASINESSSSTQLQGVRVCTYWVGTTSQRTANICSLGTSAENIHSRQGQVHPWESARHCQGMHLLLQIIADVPFVRLGLVSRGAGHPHPNAKTCQVSCP